jgi:hypothetical protein
VTPFEDMFEFRSILLSLSFAHIVELRLGMDFGFRFRDPNHTKNTGEGGEGRPGRPEGLMKRWRKLKRVRKIPSLTCESQDEVIVTPSYCTYYVDSTYWYY